MRRGQRTGSMASTEVASSSRMLSHISFRFRLLTSSPPPPLSWASGLVGGSDGLSSSHGSAHSLRITGSLSHLRTMLPESSSCPQLAQRPNHAT